MKNLHSALIKILMMGLILVSCDEDDPQIKITSISFDTASVEVVEGTTVNLDDHLTIEGEDANQAQITFASSDEEVVTVSGNTLTAAGVGQTTVQATEANTSQTATIDVTVIANTVEVTGVTLDKETADLKVGETMQLTATVAPSDATEQGVTWSVDFPSGSKTQEESPTDIATVSEAGLVTAVSAGDVVVTAKTKDGDFTASVALSITNIAVTEVTLSAINLSVNVGETGQLMATVSPSNATIQNITWSLALADEGDPESYATIDASTGMVTGVSECDACGLAIVATTEDGGFTAYADLFVVYIPVTSVTIDQSTFTVTVGETQQMTASVLPENASDKSITWSVETSSSSCRTTAAAPVYASVDEEGLVTGVKNQGCYTLTVVATSADGPSQSLEFDVFQPVTSITIIDDQGDEFPGKSTDMYYYDSNLQLYISILPSDASDQTVTWSLEQNDGAISVSNTGEVSGGIDGTDRVIVTTNDGTNLTDYLDVTYYDYY